LFSVDEDHHESALRRFFSRRWAAMRDFLAMGGMDLISAQVFDLRIGSQVAEFLGLREREEETVGQADGGKGFELFRPAETGLAVLSQLEVALEFGGFIAGGGFFGAVEVGDRVVGEVIGLIEIEEEIHPGDDERDSTGPDGGLAAQAGGVFAAADAKPERLDKAGEFGVEVLAGEGVEQGGDGLEAFLAIGGDGTWSRHGG